MSAEVVVAQEQQSAAEESGELVEIDPESADEETLESALEDLRNAERDNEADDSVPATKGQQPVKPQQETQMDTSELAALKAQVAKLEGQVKAKERFIQRQATDIGELRKRSQTLEDRKQQLEAKLNESAGADPVMTHKLQRAIDQTERELAETQAQEHVAATTTRNQQMIQSAIASGVLKEDEFDVELMAETLQNEGTDARVIQAFKANPFAIDAQATYHLAKRAKAEKVIRQLLPLMKQLVDENKALQKKPSRVLDNVQKVLSQKPTITAKAQGASDAEELPTNVPDLSDAELNALLSKRHKRR